MSIDLSCATAECPNLNETKNTNSGIDLNSNHNNHDDNCDNDDPNNSIENYDSSGDNGALRCERCDFETSSNSSLMSHVAGCQGDERRGKIFECDVCQIKFSNGANMRRHKMRHTGVKPYECKICQKRFFRKDHLAEHFTTHTKTLPYHCPICNRGFQRQIAMRAHFQNEHVGQIGLIKSCPLCSYKAGSMKSLRIHFFNRHGIDLDSSTPTNGLCSNRDDERGESGTPPMHFLTPHVEISMAEAHQPVYSPKQDDQTSDMNGDYHCQNGDDPPSSPNSGDSITPPNGRSDSASPLTPSVSLIPIKQEPGQEDEIIISKQATNCTPINLSTSSNNIHSNNPIVSSLMSPLKSLLREDRPIRTPASLQITTAPCSTPTPPISATEVTSCDSSANANGSISLWRTNSHTTRNYGGNNLNGRLSCPFCGITFPDQTLYFLHKGCHSGEMDPWKCNICGERTNNVYDFNAHLLSKTHK